MTSSQKLNLARNNHLTWSLVVSYHEPQKAYASSNPLMTTIPSSVEQQYEVMKLAERILMGYDYLLPTTDDIKPTTRTQRPSKNGDVRDSTSTPSSKSCRELILNMLGFHNTTLQHQNVASNRQTYQEKYDTNEIMSRNQMDLHLYKAANNWIQLDCDFVYDYFTYVGFV